MKAEVLGSNKQAVLRLIPETVQDEQTLREFAMMTVRMQHFHCKGFEYLRPEVEFLIQPIGTSD